MADHPVPHPDLAGFLVEGLEPAEHDRFARHLAECPQCRAQVEELAPLPGLLKRAGAPFTVPTDLGARTLGAIEGDAGQTTRRPRGRLLRTGVAVAAAMVVAGSVVVGIQTREHGAGPLLPSGTPGPVEARAVLRDPDHPERSAVAEVHRLPAGRLVDFRTSQLRPLPGRSYELWFVGPGDGPGSPNRVSAGTFHPDARGRAQVQLTADVDPARYPVLDVTAEPRDGDPGRGGPEVMRSGVAPPR